MNTLDVSFYPFNILKIVQAFARLSCELHCIWNEFMLLSLPCVFCGVSLVVCVLEFWCGFLRVGGGVFCGLQSYVVSPPSLALRGHLHTHLQEQRDFRSTLMSGVLLISHEAREGQELILISFSASFCE